MVSTIVHQPRADVKTPLPSKVVIPDGYRLAPAPVQSPDCATTFDLGEKLLIADKGKNVVVEVTNVRVSTHQVRPDLAVKWVLYTITFADVVYPVLACHRVLGEKALEKIFRAYVEVK